MLYPATEEVLAFQVRLTLCAGVDPDPPEDVPVPERVSVNEELPALLTKDALAVAAPLLCGLNVIVKVAVLPAWIVSGRVIPLMVYSALLVPAEDTTTLAPLADRVPLMFLLLPTATLPKLMLAGETASVPLPTPVPVSEIEICGALLVMAMLPVLLPLFLGAKTTVKV